MVQDDNVRAATRAAGQPTDPQETDPMRITRLAGLVAAGALALTAAAPGRRRRRRAWSVSFMARLMPRRSTSTSATRQGRCPVRPAFGDITAYTEVPAGTYGIKVCATADDGCLPDRSRRPRLRR